MESGQAHEDEHCSCNSPTQADANEPRENYSENSSSTCRIHSRGSQEPFWPAGLPREVLQGIPLYWGISRPSSDSIDAIEADPDNSSSSNANTSVGSEVWTNFNVNVEASSPTGRHHRRYRRNPFSSNGPRENRTQHRGSLHAPSSQQILTSEGAIGDNTLFPIAETTPLRQPHFNTNGWFPDEHLLGEEIMEENPTQKATQPIVDQRREDAKTMDNEMDEGDVICLLHPASPAAYHAIELIASKSPQHILQNRGLSHLFDKPEDQDSQAGIQHDSINQHQSTTPTFRSVRPDEEVHPCSPKDIALRLTSRLRDPCMGFVFGRGLLRCDLMLSRDADYERKISGAHFRIYFNPVGVLMLQDMSTNGTSVDGNLLKGGKLAAGSDSKRMIAGGEIIELLLAGRDTGHMRFLVTMPKRDDGGNMFNHNLAKYFAWRDQAERRAQAFAQAAVDGLHSITPPVHIPFNPFNDPIKDSVASSDDNPVNLNLAGRKFNHGMEWSGGDRFNVVGYIGRGAFANVYKLATKRDGELYAAKQIEKRHFMKNNTLDSKIHNEINIMRKLHHPNIVEFVEHREEPHHLYIIMEFVPGGDLTSFIKAGTAMAEYMCQSVAQQICDAVDYLHGCKVTHRDIKPDNILIQTRDPLFVKLSDFGLSKWVANEETFLKSFCGTLLYCAPEIYPDYGMYKGGVQGKRARNSKMPLKTSPYKPSVDTWALGAVLYHLLCGTPPFRGGSSDDRGSSMLEIVMTTPLDRGRLRNAGVSEEGIEFVSKMLVVDPAGRSTEAELLKHPWITKIGPGDEHDVQMQGGLGALDCVDEDGNELDASRLSLAENPGHRGIVDGEEELDTDIEAGDGGRESKRVKLDNSDDQLQGSEGPSTDQISYPQLPGVPTDSVYSEPTPAPITTTGRLFGEIGASALRSSGVLGYNAHAALQMPLEGSRDESFDTSASWIDDARIIGDEGVPSAAHYPQALHGPAYMGSAPSLLGAEALVGQLNMTSPGSGASAPSLASTFEVPRTPRTRDASLAPAGSISGSRGSSQVPRSFIDQATSKRQKTNSSETPSAHHGALSARQHRSEGSPIDGGVQNIEPELYKPANSASPPPATATTEEEKASVSGSEARSGVDPTGEGDMQAKGNPSQSQHAISANASTSVSDSGSTSGRVARDTASPVSFPKPPPRFGTLTALPGSLCNTTIRLERRITYYGRDPSSHARHPDPKESRIPKNALDVIFWRPGIEAMIESGKDWSTLDGLYAIVSTRTSKNIKINGVKLTKGEGCWNYGRLHTGDVITIFGPHEGEKVEGKAAEYLKFRCDFSIGLSAQPRAQDQPRFVVEKEEEKFMQNQMRRSVSSASHGSKSTA